MPRIRYLESNNTHRRRQAAFHTGHKTIFLSSMDIFQKYGELQPTFIMKRWRNNNLAVRFCCGLRRWWSYFHKSPYFGKLCLQAMLLQFERKSTGCLLLLESYRIRFDNNLNYTRVTSKCIDIIANVAHCMSFNSFVPQIESSSHCHPFKWFAGKLWICVMNRCEIIEAFLVGNDNVVLSVEFIVGSRIFFID
jgi:hypothetical protein